MNHLQTLAQARTGKPHPNKGRKFPIELLTDQEVSAIIKRCSPRCPTGVRNRAAIALLYRGSLRVSELIGLAPRDLDASQGTLCVRHGKGDKRRLIGLDAATIALVQLWLIERTKLGIGNQCPLFTTLRGKPVSRFYLRNLVKRLAERCGIEKRVHPHGFRHCGAVSMLKDGMNIPEVSKALGHSSISTTATYLSHVCPTELVTKMNARTWVIDSN
jgi:site-specific recombinase XerD